MYEVGTKLIQHKEINNGVAYTFNGRGLIIEIVGRNSFRIISFPNNIKGINPKDYDQKGFSEEDRIFEKYFIPLNKLGKLLYG